MASSHLKALQIRILIISRGAFPSTSSVQAQHKVFQVGRRASQVSRTNIDLVITNQIDYLRMPAAPIALPATNKIFLINREQTQERFPSPPEQTFFKKKYARIFAIFANAYNFAAFKHNKKMIASFENIISSILLLLCGFQRVS
ncbi:MAG: hypothetical protein BGN96_03050 [Bacteroidales bacterium 45-6]|nr:MAG: hypothetical protein BGN96_03050 [Bacteroidales bacterium 45-6]